MTRLNWNDSEDEVYLNEVLFEFHNLGNSVRVCAIDPITNTEVVVVGSTYMTPFTLKENALRKLRYVLAKKQKEQRAEKKRTRQEPFRR